MGYKEIGTLALTPFEYMRDFARMIKWSKASPFCPEAIKLKYEILLLAHTVEKGLSSFKPRPKFGFSKISALLGWLSSYKSDWDRFPLEKSYGCLLAYVKWHDEIGVEIGPIRKEIENFFDRCQVLGVVPKGGVKVLDVSNLAPNPVAQQFLLSRFSSRRYADVIIPSELIDGIVAIARRAPSQCNRQSVRLHYYARPEQIDALLKLQGGAEEFRASVKNLFVVTSEISGWSGYKARSQAYVDGALVAMQVLNACQALGFAACPLNLAISNRREGEICLVGNISQGERLILMIAFGYPLPGDVVAARSERISEEVLLSRH